MEAVLVEERAAIAVEYYAAILSDTASKGPLVMFSSEGGMDVEEVAASMPERLRRAPVDIAHGFHPDAAHAMLGGLGLGADEAPVADTLVALYRAYRDNDAELLEVNPLARLEDGRLVALDCKFTLDDSGIKRREALAASGRPERLTGLEARGQALGLRVHRARRRHRRARQRRRTHHDHHGRDHPPRGTAGELPRDREAGRRNIRRPSLRSRSCSTTPG